MSAAQPLNNTLGERLVQGTENLKPPRKRPAILGVPGNFVKMKEFAHAQPGFTSAQRCRNGRSEPGRAEPPAALVTGGFSTPGLSPARDYGKSHFAA